jgi:Protein of unknown function (DUF4236)
LSWRFRKTFAFGPARTTLTRRGLGASWRFPGFRIGRAANGRWYLSFGIPGSGFYWIKHF